MKSRCVRPIAKLAKIVRLATSSLATDFKKGGEKSRPSVFFSKVDWSMPMNDQHMFSRSLNNSLHAFARHYGTSVGKMKRQLLEKKSSACRAWGLAKAPTCNAAAKPLPK